MSSNHYFYLAPNDWSEEVLLKGQEAQHLQKVLRLTVGTEITLLDGQGRTGTFEIKAFSNQGVNLKQKSLTNHPRPKSCPIMALALSKAVRRGFFMEKAVELGAAGVWLWQGDQSQGKLNPKLQEVCERQMIAGAKQCHNPWLPEVKIFTKGLAELLKNATNITQRVLPWELESTSKIIPVDLLGRNGQTLYIIGPEGGFSSNELDLLAQENFVRISLGSRILRCETAAVLCLGLHFWAANLKDSEANL